MFFSPSLFKEKGSGDEFNKLSFSVRQPCTYAAGGSRYDSTKGLPRKILFKLLSKIFY
jgi:hypothetical protein